MIRLSLFLISLFTFISLSGTHISGGNIQYSYVGPGSQSGTHQYEIRVGIYRWCAGANVTGTTHQITAKCATSGATQIYNLSAFNYVSKPGERPSNQGKRDISDICRSKQTNCHSVNGFGGSEEVIYKGVITLGSCNYWEITAKTGRVASSFSSTGQEFLRTRFNTNAYPINSGPKYPSENKPITSAYVGQARTYAIEANDPDDDSLVYELICPSSSSSIGYKCFTATSGITLDSLTGKISFNKPSNGEFFISFWVKEYDRCTGGLKGQTERGVSISAHSSINKIPKDISGISNLKGNVTKTGTYSLEVCQGEKISWQDTIFDPDLTDTIHVRSNVDIALPGGKMSTTYLTPNKAVVTFEWVATYTKSKIRILNLLFDDNKCNFPGHNASVFTIKNNLAASAGPDQEVCFGDTALLEGQGGLKYTWRSISGTPIVTGVNWFPDTTTQDTGKNVRFIPVVATLLEVKTDLKGRCSIGTSCKKLDTILIKPVDSFQLAITPDQLLCYPAKGELKATPSNNKLKYTYRWNNSTYLSSDSIQNPLFSNIKKSISFTVTVTNDSGCTRIGKTQVKVTDPIPLNMKAMISDTLVCLNKQVKLWVDRGSVNYNNCDISTYKCQGIFKNYTLGSGTVVNQSRAYSLPMTYGSYAYSQKSQYLYKASDLKSMGMEAGPINSIAWELQSLYNSTSSPFNNFTIKVGCTNIANLPNSGFVKGLIEVFTPKSILPIAGWNNHKFDNEYVWDGKSNLVVEVCWTDGIARLNGQHAQKFDTKSYQASNTYYQQYTWNASACSNPTLSPNFPSTSLPRTRFNACTGIRSSLFNYSWGPTANGRFVGATNQDSALANVQLSSTKKYFVIVQDSANSVCKDTLEVGLNVVSSYNVKPHKLPSQCLKYGYIPLTSNTHWKITSPGGRWTGLGVVNDTLGIWDPNKSGPGKFWVKYSVTGDACAAADSVEIHIVGLPDPSLISPDTLCGLYGGGATPDTVRHRLVPKKSGGWFSGFGVDSILDGNGDMVYWLDGTKFNPSVNLPDTAFINYSLIDVCAADCTMAIPVIAPWDHTFLGVKDNGVAYLTTNFCLTSSIMDTLSVAGGNPTWEYLDGPSAMIDKKLGVFDASSLNYNSDTSGRMKVGNYGFCGSDTTFRVQFIKPPQVEVFSKTYCASFINDTANFTKYDTVFIRIPKGPNVPGSTGKKDLDTNGFDPSTEVKHVYGSIAATGWPQVIDQVSGQYNYNYWDGKPWMLTKYIARYRLLTIPMGKNVIRYNLGFRYRQNHPNNFSCASIDSGYVERIDSLFLTLKDTHRICGSNSVTLDAGQYKDAKYDWSDGSSNQTISTSKKGIYTVTVTTDYCRATKQTAVLDGCVGVEQKLEVGVKIKLFPNPVSTSINLQVNGAKSELTHLKIIDVLGSEVYSTSLISKELKDYVRIDVSQLQAGTYFFNIVSGESHSTYRVIVE